MLVFAGTTGQLITAVLRPGTGHASQGALAVLTRLVRPLRARWPQVASAVRADGGCAVPALYAYCEAQRSPYTSGLRRHARRAALAAPLAPEAQQQRGAPGEKVRVLAAGTYDVSG